MVHGRAGLGVLRAPTHLLRSPGSVLGAEAIADARSGHPVPPATKLLSDRQAMAPVCWSRIGPDCVGETEGWRARSARQRLPQDGEVGRPGVASAWARGGPPIPQARQTLPVLDFPEPGIDDTASYQGYKTRFYRDSKRNTVQIYLDPRGGRVVTLLANAANESVGFTVRDSEGRPARLNWATAEAQVTDSGTTRTIEYELTADASRIGVGLFLLGSMRVERDFQYAKRHLRPFTSPPFLVAEESLLVADVQRLPISEQRDRKSTRLNSSHSSPSRMPSSA